MADLSERIALPIQVHEFLLACAGRIDDDALTDTRELLAVAELDRAVELLAGSIVAGRIAITSLERDTLAGLISAVRSSASLLDRVVVDDSTRLPRHRFTVGADTDPNPDDGVADAVGHVVEVLPDIRSVSCVWRTTPAGATSGPVPQRMVLVETGPDGFAPSTAYRVEQALRRAGISATVEVVQAGAELTDYHRGALTAARRITLRSSGPAPRVPESVEPLFAESPAPRPVTSTRRRAGSVPVDKRLPSQSASGRWQQRIAAARSDEPTIADTSVPAVGSGTAEPASSMASAEPMPSASVPANAVTTSGAETSRSTTTPVSETTLRNARQDGGAHLASGASSVSSGSVPSTELSDRSAVDRSAVDRSAVDRSAVEHSAVEHSPAEHGSVDHRPAIADEETTAATAKPPASDAELSQREQELLRQLHEELAKREQPEAAGVSELPGVTERPAWQVDRSGQRHGAFPTVDYGAGSWQSGQDQTAVNGLPPYGGTPGGSTGH